LTASNDFQIYRLRRQHRRLAEVIEYESGLPVPDTARLTELKRRKLRLKDRLALMESAGAH